MSHNSLTDIQWARITPDKVVVATANRTWLHQLDPARSDDPFAQQMVSAGSVETTRRLLEGAVASAHRAVSPSNEPPTLSPRRWVWRLAGSYHLNRCTPQLLEAVCPCKLLKA
ncbi:hypothetical protein [Brasilonema bromeliae]|uniref:hypothetical protein n=1 Tax=Brasilonema bromeliae TaxID=383615 RepID=UPI00145EC632|nr:hypothetical protein [Brasilonema bromeliae]